MKISYLLILSLFSLNVQCLIFLSPESANSAEALDRIAFKNHRLCVEKSRAYRSFCVRLNYVDATPIPIPKARNVGPRVKTLVDKYNNMATKSTTVPSSSPTSSSFSSANFDESNTTCDRTHHDNLIIALLLSLIFGSFIFQLLTSCRLFNNFLKLLQRCLPLPLRLSIYLNSRRLVVDLLQDIRQKLLLLSLPSTTKNLSTPNPKILSTPLSTSSTSVPIPSTFMPLNNNPKKRIAVSDCFSRHTRTQILEMDTTTPESPVTMV